MATKIEDGEDDDHDPGHRAYTLKLSATIEMYMARHRLQALHMHSLQGSPGRAPQAIGGLVTCVRAVAS